MQRPAYIPDAYPSVVVVDNAEALYKSHAPGVNCHVLPRALSIDFNPLAETLRTAISPGSEFMPLSSDFMRSVVRESPRTELHAAARFIADDMDRLLTRFNHCTLNVIGRYDERDKDNAFALHADNSDIASICYNDPSTRYAHNADIAKVEKSAGRTRYTLKHGAALQAFRPGDLVYAAGLESRSAEDAFIHCGPNPAPGGPARLFLYAYNMPLTF